MIAHDRSPADDKVLRAVGIRKEFASRRSWLRNRSVTVAVHDVSLEVIRGQTLGLVGESGCGKTTLAKVLLQLERATAGHVWFEGNDLTSLSASQLRKLRPQVQMIFQDPYSSLNPRMRIKEIVSEGWQGSTRRRQASGWSSAEELLEQVGLSPDMANRYPHQLSGGQRQRVGIARALATRPKLIVCDEPVSALDVSVQAQVINLLSDLQRDLGLTYVFISHDLSVVEHVSDHVAVMYLGKIVEQGAARSIFDRPAHPYTQALLAAVPSPDVNDRAERRVVLKGEVSIAGAHGGCPFAARCFYRQQLEHDEIDTSRCFAEAPVLRNIGATQSVACHYAESADTAATSCEPS